MAIAVKSEVNAAPGRMAVPTLAQAKKMDSSELLALYNKGALATSYGVRCMAIAYVAMRDRGDDVSAFQHGMVKYFDRVVQGRLVPQILLAFAGSPAHLEQVSRLVPEEQQKLLAPDAYVRVVRRVADGSVETRQKLPSACTVDELALVIGEGKLRSPAEQERFLPARAKIAPIAARPAAEDHTDVWQTLTVHQRSIILAHAEKKSQTVAQFLRNLLIQQKIIPGRMT